MIYPKKNKLIHWFFHTYVQWIVRRHFHSINFNTIEVDRSRSVLLIANHFSWWDGFLLYWVSRKLFRKNFHIMLLEQTSKHVPILKYGGAFSINKKSRSILESLDFAAQLLNDPDNLVLIFPQGKLYSNFIDEVDFEKGIMRVLNNAAGKLQLIFSATFIENFQHKKPTAYVSLANAENDVKSIDEFQAAYQQHYNTAKQQQTQIVIQ